MTTKTNELTLFQIAADSLEAADGDWGKATQLGVLRLKDPGTPESLREQAFRDVVYTEIRHVAATQRKHMMATMPHDQSPQPGKAARGAGGIVAMARSFMDYPLAGGMLLGDATKPKLLEEAQYLWDVSKTNERRALWFIGIASKLDGRQKVRDVLTNEDLIEIDRGAQEKVAASFPVDMPQKTKRKLISIR